MRFLLLVIGVLGVARLTAAQESHIGGAQTSNARVVSPARTRTPTSSGMRSLVVIPSPKAPHIPAKPEPTILNAPTSPDSPVQLSEAAFAQLIVHRQAAMYPGLARSTHAKGAVVLDVVLDQSGHLESADPIGAEDFTIACMQAIQAWKFVPYHYQGRPWKVSGSIRFNFTNPPKGTSD
jgi:TonB family protein